MSDPSGQVPAGGGQPPVSYPVPPGAAPPSPATPPQKKKGRGCIIAASIVAVLLVCCLGSVAFAFMNVGKPKDLGVRYTEADYWKAVDKAGLQVVDATGAEAPSVPANQDIAPASVPTTPIGKGGPPKLPTKPIRKPAKEDWTATEVRYSGTKKVDLVFTGSEVSALLNFSHEVGWPLKDVQVRFPGGNAVDMSGVVSFEGRDYPFYVSGSAGISGSTMSGAISSAQVMGWSIPSEYYPPASDFALSMINDRLSRLGGLDITTAEVVDGGLHLVGTIPATAERVRR